jgi:hypothetical protein
VGTQIWYIIDEACSVALAELVMLRKNGLWQHSGAIEQLYRLTGKIFGRAVTVVIRVSSI